MRRPFGRQTSGFKLLTTLVSAGLCAVEENRNRFALPLRLSIQSAESADYRLNETTKSKRK